MGFEEIGVLITRPVCKGPYLLYKSSHTILASLCSPLKQARKLSIRTSCPSEERILSMRKRVLLVEDELSHQELIQTALELSGYTVTLARNGVEAFEKLATETPCVIVLDLWMPEMSGYTFPETWRERN